MSYVSWSRICLSGCLMLQSHSSNLIPSSTRKLHPSQLCLCELTELLTAGIKTTCEPAMTPTTIKTSEQPRQGSHSYIYKGATLLYIEDGALPLSLTPGLIPVTCATDTVRDIGQHGKPKCCLSMKVLSAKLTPSLECHRPAWRHGGASFMKPIPALLQMSHSEFFTTSQSLGRQSRKPHYIWGQAPLKLTATAATAKLAEGERERVPLRTVCMVEPQCNLLATSDAEFYAEQRQQVISMQHYDHYDQVYVFVPVLSYVMQMRGFAFLLPSNGLVCQLSAEREKETLTLLTCNINRGQLSLHTCNIKKSFINMDARKDTISHIIYISYNVSEVEKALLCRRIQDLHSVEGYMMMSNNCLVPHARSTCSSIKATLNLNGGLIACLSAYATLSNAFQLPALKPRRKYIAHISKAKCLVWSTMTDELAEDLGGLGDSLSVCDSRGAPWALTSPHTVIEFTIRHNA
ncbi:hypothetical protein EXN66_Car016847 [Channa argus]|uniref:Uncharacterized protein n=1 Tax=Channa argus TaxID=215402 RepID=A0A6G1QFJ0_CHAAH|nr:hypothetical protein EXN66_Car016847 [Channa argus]